MQESLKAITLKEMINLAGQSWNAVSAMSIKKCWRKGLATAFPAPLEAVVDVRNQDSDSDDNDEEFEGFTQAATDLKSSAYRSVPLSKHSQRVTALKWQFASQPVYLRDNKL